MNEIQQMKILLLKEFPTAKITLDEPLIKDGVWSLDVFLPDYHLAIAWKVNKGFGLVWDNSHGYGEGAQEVYKEFGEAFSRITQLVAERIK